jgi:hypothetical protein
MNYDGKLIKIILMSMILFLIINFFIKSSHEKQIIDKIIMSRQNVDDNNFIYKLEKIKQKYLTERFKINVTRSIFFGIGMLIIIIYINKKKVPTKIEYFEKQPF